VFHITTAEDASSTQTTLRAERSILRRGLLRSTADPQEAADFFPPPLKHGFSDTEIIFPGQTAL